MPNKRKVNSSKYNAFLQKQRTILHVRYEVNKIFTYDFLLTLINFLCAGVCMCNCIPVQAKSAHGGKSVHTEWKSKFISYVDEKIKKILSNNISVK